MLCTDVYPVQVRYNKKVEKIQATFVFEAVNDRTGALILRLTQRLVLGLPCYVVSHVYSGVCMELVGNLWEIKICGCMVTLVISDQYRG